MSTPKVSTLSRLVMTLVAAGLITAPGSTLATKPDPKLQQMSSAQAVAQKIKPAQRQAAADRLKAAKAAATAAGLPAAAALVTDPLTGALVPDYFGGVPNWAFSPPTMRKFLDTLPDLKDLIATPDKVTFPDSDYYEIELIEYTWNFHTDLGQIPTKLRGYRQTNIIDRRNCPARRSDVRLCVSSLPPPSYLGPVIVATKGPPTRIKFTNNLPAGANGNLFIPTDTSVMGAGTGPDGTNYPQNRATLHLHGGFTPWVSDGTPHQWVTPSGETAPLKRGVSTQDVPDMNLSSGNSMTFYWPNQQSGRLMFYHDHAYGITRLNVYAGEAAGYLLYDPAEEALLATTGVPGTLSDLPHMIPLVIQDRTFVHGAPPALDLRRNNLGGRHVRHGSHVVRSVEAMGPNAGKSVVPPRLHAQPESVGRLRRQRNGPLGLRAVVLAAVHRSAEPRNAAQSVLRIARRAARDSRDAEPVAGAGSVHGHAGRQRQGVSDLDRGSDEVPTPHPERGE